MSLDEAREVARANDCELVTQHLLRDMARTNNENAQLRREVFDLRRRLYERRRRWWWAS